MIEKEESIKQEALRAVALKMMTAARTAPKAKGADHLEIAALTHPDDFRPLIGKMMEIAPRPGRAFFERDAHNIAASAAVVLIGTRRAVLNLNCGWCGYPTCGAKVDQAPAVPCAFNMNDLGIAVGSAVSVAADNRVDCRVMFSAGVAAMELDLLPGCHCVLAIPVSASSKSPFFDRK